MKFDKNPQSKIKSPITISWKALNKNGNIIAYQYT